MLGTKLAVLFVGLCCLIAGISNSYLLVSLYNATTDNLVYTAADVLRFGTEQLDIYYKMHEQRIKGFQNSNFDDIKELKKDLRFLREGGHFRLVYLANEDDCLYLVHRFKYHQT